MSDFRAVAAVTATLQRMLLAALPTDVPGANVTTVHPAARAGGGIPSTGVNIFLYEVRPNTHQRNRMLLSRSPGGELVERPVAALDLDYLFSFYGAEATLEPQLLLGSTVAFWEAQPILPRAEIEAAIAANPHLLGCTLADQDELVRLSPLEQSLEEKGRLWSTLLQTGYTLSVSYRASVVFVERTVRTRQAPAVGEDGVVIEVGTSRRAP